MENVVMPGRRELLVSTVTFLPIVFFVLAGLCVIPYLGLQADEALFGSAIYGAEWTPGWIWVLGRHMPMMVMSYVGALKAWVYAPLLAVWNPSLYAVRVPVILLGAFTIWGVYRLLVRVHGRRAALIGCTLLATDTTYLLTTCFDWGPVAFQHALAVGGVLLLVKFHQTSSRLCLGLAFFLFGLALWDKALFGWTLVGLAAGALCANPRALWRAVSLRNVTLAAVCFCAGAFPLIRHNVRFPLETFRTNVGWSAESLDRKAHILRSSLDGSGLIGYLAYDDPAPNPRAPRTALERLSVSVDRLAGAPRRGWMPYCVAAALLMLPFLWRTPARRPVLFAAVCLAVVWALMLFGKETGGSVHHTALLWPWPHLLVAPAFAEFSRRFGRRGLVAVVLIAGAVAMRNVQTTNVYLSQFIRNGGAVVWSDAIYPLADYLPEAQAEEIYVLDWGVLDPLRVLSRGRLRVLWGADQLLKNPLNEEDLGYFRQMIQQPEHLFVKHTPSHEVFTGVSARFGKLLEAEGYRIEMLRTIPDTNGRPVFEVFRVRPQVRPG
jgi:hypothetical protein